MCYGGHIPLSFPPPRIAPFDAKAYSGVGRIPRGHLWEAPPPILAPFFCAGALPPRNNLGTLGATTGPKTPRLKKTAQKPRQLLWLKNPFWAQPRTPACMDTHPHDTERKPTSTHTPPHTHFPAHPSTPTAPLAPVIQQ